jgi:hypothetical protein
MRSAALTEQPETPDSWVQILAMRRREIDKADASFGAATETLRTIAEIADIGNELLSKSKRPPWWKRLWWRLRG